MVRASGLRGYSTLMRQLGADPDQFLRRHRINPDLLLDDDALLPLRATAQLFEDSAASTNCADFGLRLADQQDISVLGPLAIAMQHAPTVAAALDMISRYLFMHSRGMSVSIHAESELVPGAVEVRFDLQVPGRGALRQTLDVCLGDVHHFIELLAGRYALRAVSLPHTPLAPLSVYNRFFGAPVRPAQRHGALHIARETFELRLPTVNESLQRIAVDYLAQHFGSPEQTLAMHVRQLLQRTLGTAPSDKRAIAELLNLHPRTLQRYLEAEGTSFDSIRDAVQRELAQRYLCETGIPLTQLAGMLGYAEQSVLTRACRRWFGQTPTQLRRAVANAPPVRRPALASARPASQGNGRTKSR